MQVSIIQKGRRFAGSRWSWVIDKVQAGWTAMNSRQQKAQARTADVEMGGFAQTVLQVVLWVGFAGFLFASLPHVAYFFATFEPEDPSGVVNDYWWMVSYILAIAIDVTSFFLSFNVAIKMRRATAGLAWYQKIIPALLVFLAHWPFILALVGFSWLVNFEHAKQFHSSMLDIAEQAQINLILWQGKLADLNPIIASAFPVLAVAYTGMADRIGDERRGGTVKEDVKDNAQVVAGTVNPVQQNVQPQALDIEAILETMQAMNAQNLQAMQQMTQQSLQVTIEQFTKVTVQAVKETVQALPTYMPVNALPEPGKTTSNAQETEEVIAVPKPKPPLQSENDQSAQTYGDQIEALYKKNPDIGPSEIVSLIGCSRQTASNWLKRVRPVEQ